MKILSPCFLSLTTAMLLLTPLARADQTIIQSNNSTGDIVQVFQPLGQSFTAVGTTLTNFQFYINPATPAAPLTSLTMEILAGDGLGGTVLDTEVLTPSAGYNGWFGSDLSVATTFGSQYTAVLTDTNVYWGVDGANSDVYSGGQAYVRQEADENHIRDFAFQATFSETSSAVPDGASTLALTSASLGVLLIASRRKRSSR